jgi:membrane-associated phospholipid phosphatase
LLLYSVVAFFRPALALTFVGISALGFADDTARTVSGAGTYLYLGAGLALPLLRDGSLGRERFWRTADALGTSLLLSEGLKAAIHAPRPDGSGDDSFPSGHATLAFTVATMASQFHPREAPLWYAGAGWIGYSRVQLRKHNVLDVLAGAGLGYGVARAELSLPHGLILQPLIGRRGGAGLMVSGSF